MSGLSHSRPPSSEGPAEPSLRSPAVGSKGWAVCSVETPSPPWTAWASCSSSPQPAGKPPPPDAPPPAPAQSAPVPWAASLSPSLSPSLLARPGPCGGDCWSPPGRGWAGGSERAAQRSAPGWERERVYWFLFFSLPKKSTFIGENSWH